MAAALHSFAPHHEEEEAEKEEEEEEEEEEEDKMLNLDKHLTEVTLDQNWYTPNDSKMGNPFTSGPSLIL